MARTLEIKFSVCVFCGARDNVPAPYIAAAGEMGRIIAKNGWRLVYGAGDAGLMGEVARHSQAGGGESFGVIPQHLVARERGKLDLTHFIVTETMHERKKVMLMNSDAIVVLPGGAGTLDEFFEMLTWAQLGLHQKPIFILNCEGYWDLTLKQIERFIETGFALPSLRELFQICDEVDEIEAGLRAVSARQASAE